MAYKIFTFTMIIITIASLYGCGTQKLRSIEYIEVGRGEKALLITNNSETFNFFDLLFDDLIGESESVVIDSVDDKKISVKFFKENQHVLIEPGQRKIGLSCRIHYKDKSKEDIIGDIIIKMEFKGGYTYKTSVTYKAYKTCETKIELEKYVYNKSLKSDAAQETHSAP